MDKLTVLSIDTDISTLAVKLVGQYTLSHKLSLPDALIASTAIIHNIPLYTLNVRDFRFLEDVELFDGK